MMFGTGWDFFGMFGNRPAPPPARDDELYGVPLATVVAPFQANAAMEEREHCLRELRELEHYANEMAELNPAQPRVGACRDMARRISAARCRLGDPP